MERLLVKLAHKDFMEHSARYLFSLITNKLVFCVPPSGLFCKTQLAFPIPYSILERSYYQTKMMQDPKVTQFELIESKMIRPSNCHIYIPKCILFHVSKKNYRNVLWGHTRMRQAQISHFVTFALQMSSRNVPFLLAFEVSFFFHPLCSTWLIH
jgi:hypothetical protein